jgi:ABC-type bacteriocin/lantibiotic exporter with double-glycine peptidase domain
MLSYSVFLTALGVVGAILNLLALEGVSRKRRDLNKRLLQEKGKLTGVTMSGIYMIETLKSAGREDDFFARWSGYQAKTTSAGQELGFWSAMLDRVPPFLASMNAISVLGFGGVLVMQGFLTLGDMMAFQALLSGFIQPINNLVGLGSQLQEIEGDLGRLDDVLANPVDEELTKAEAVKLTPDLAEKLNGKVEINNISFAYGRFDKPFVNQFSLTINPGSRVALGGASGSGKSTLGNLVAGLYTPTQGEIRFDGKLRSEIPRLVMANSLAKVDQDVILFEGSIRDNIALWNDSVTDAAIIQAAKDACIHDVISSRPLGYEDQIIEAGRNFSGGQRQRLEIARALALEPSILILDEATSALDPLTEKIIDDNLRRRGCSCLIIAHRLSTIRDSDEIIVLKGGQVIERGLHDELVALNGYYAELLKDT